MEGLKRKMMSIEGEEQEHMPVDNHFVVSTPSGSMRKKFKRTQSVVSGTSQEEEQVSTQSTTACASEERNKAAPKDLTVFYDPPSFGRMFLKMKLDFLKETREIWESDETNESPFNRDYLFFWKDTIHDLNEDIMYCLENFGLWCAYQVVQKYLESCKIGNIAYLNGLQDLKIDYLTEAGKLIEEYIPSAMKNGESIEEGNLRSVKEGFLSSKMHALLNCIRSRDYNDMCCLITVESMLSAVAVSSLMKGLSEYEYINRYYLPRLTTGPHIIIWKRKQNSSKHFGFREVHVLCEMKDIDATQYNCIINFDLPKTIRSYILGGKSKADCVVLIERKNKEQQDSFCDLIMREYLSSQEIDMSVTSEDGTKKYSISVEDGEILEGIDNDNMENEVTSSTQFRSEKDDLYLSLVSSDKDARKIEESCNEIIETEDASLIEMTNKDVRKVEESCNAMIETEDTSLVQMKNGKNFEGSYNNKVLDEEEFLSRKMNFDYSDWKDFEDGYNNEMISEEFLSREMDFDYSDEGNFERSYNDEIIGEEIHSRKMEFDYADSGKKFKIGSNDDIESGSLLSTKGAHHGKQLRAGSGSKEEGGNNDDNKSGSLFSTQRAHRAKELRAGSGSKKDAGKKHAEVPYAGSPPKEDDVSLGTRKGEARSSLFKLCSRMKWSNPEFTMLEKGGTPHAPTFVFNVSIKLNRRPNSPELVITGEPKNRANLAKDSAALLMLREIEERRLGRIR